MLLFFLALTKYSNSCLKMDVIRIMQLLIINNLKSARENEHVVAYLTTGKLYCLYTANNTALLRSRSSTRIENYSRLANRLRRLLHQ